MQEKQQISIDRVRSDFNSVIPEISNLIQNEASKFPKQFGIDHDDMVQEALIRIWQQRDTWNPSKGAGFKRWSLIVARNRYRRIYNKETPTNPMYVDGYSDVAYGTRTDSSLEFEMLVRTIRNSLRGKTRDIFDALVKEPEDLKELAARNWLKKEEDRRDGKRKYQMSKVPNYQDIAKYLGINNNEITKAKKKIKKVIDRVMQ